MGNAPRHETSLRNSCSNDDTKRARLAERFIVMAKAAYGGIAIKLGAAENRLQMVAQKMAPMQMVLQMQNSVQMVVQSSMQYFVQMHLQIFVQ